jgi:uncharacterized membrane protein YtjA (UPF0391 family)
MLKLAIFFFIIAVVAGLLGFRGVESAASFIAKIFFFLFLVFFLIALFFVFAASA